MTPGGLRGHDRRDRPPGRGLFRANGRILKFDGYRRCCRRPASRRTRRCRPLTERQALDRLDLFETPALHPAAAAVQRGVAGQGAGEGRHRPAEHLREHHRARSRTAATSTQETRRFFATEIGKIVTDLLVEHFPNDHGPEVHLPLRGGTRRDRDGQVPVRARCWTSSGGRSRQALKKADDGDAGRPRQRDGRDVPEVRQAAGRSGSARRPAGRSSAAPGGRTTRRASTSSRGEGEAERAGPDGDGHPVPGVRQVHGPEGGPLRRRSSPARATRTARRR